MIKSWSPSRLAKWEDCARRAKYEIVDKLCPRCFKGRMEGPWGEPQVCGTCGAVEEVAPALARGTALHEECEGYIKGKAKLPASLASAAKILSNVRREYRKGNATVEESLVFDRNWEPVSQYTKDAWLRTTLDVLTVDDELAEVIDWKSGNIDKRTGEPKKDGKHTDQLSVYATAVLSTYPKVKKVVAILVFLDAPEGKNEVMSGGLAERKDLHKLQKKWNDRVRGMLGDTIFAPRPSNSCRWCPFSKGKGGPCAF